MEKNEVKNNDKGFKKRRKLFTAIAVGMTFSTTVLVSYVRGYKRAQNIASGIVDCIADEFKEPENKKKFYDVWNYGVAKYFGTLKKN